MDTQIILLRGINVGGNNKLPMKELVGILQGLGAVDVQTYIQSGNAVARGGLSGMDIADGIEAVKGFRPSVMVMSASDFQTVADANPFSPDDGKLLHVWFLADTSDFDVNKADSLRAPSEKYHVSDTAVYLYAPDGIGRSKLVAKIEKLAGVPATARNWNTVTKLLDLAKP